MHTRNQRVEEISSAGGQRSLARAMEEHRRAVEGLEYALARAQQTEQTLKRTFIALHVKGD